jgi:catechol 2,3-dioxygenase-like lactoylglutathione lyase family enzyme
MGCSACFRVPDLAIQRRWFRYGWDSEPKEEVMADWSAKGARFLTPPIHRGAEIRCYMRDPDGHLIEVGEATGVLERG